MVVKKSETKGESDSKNIGIGNEEMGGGSHILFRQPHHSGQRLVRVCLGKQR